MSSLTPSEDALTASEHPRQHTVGFLHPGAMGSAMAAVCRGQRLWVTPDRSSATFERAAAAGLQPVTSLSELTAAVDVVVSICPPHAAVEVARQMADTGFDGIFVDANAISPATARVVSTLVERFVDGSVIGPPPTEAGLSRLYLSGPEAATVADLWRGSKLEPVLVQSATSNSVSVAASAVKMAYASWTKGSAALMLSSLALAESEGVADILRSEWDVSQPGLNERAVRTAAGVGPKGWRFVGEMNEIADAMSTAGLPAGFHQAAADVYSRLAGLRQSEKPSLETVMALLLAANEGQPEEEHP